MKDTKRTYIQSEFEILSVPADDCILTSLSTVTDSKVPDSTPLDPSIKE